MRIAKPAAIVLALCGAAAAAATVLPDFLERVAGVRPQAADVGWKGASSARGRSQGPPISANEPGAAATNGRRPYSRPVSARISAPWTSALNSYTAFPSPTPMPRHWRSPDSAPVAVA